ncbi:MAG TPA: tetratricopeptide repeat protein [Gemmatimonadaceae bacterium]|nr:tetratricopeptide repeat protein [Gemmatimonadaceae bacterium]
MMRLRLHAVGVLGVAFTLAAATRGSAQETAPALLRAMDLEQRGQNREAAAAFRQALHSPEMIAALLGMERAYAAIGQSDSTLAVADSLAKSHPTETLVQVVRLRSALYARRPAAASAAFAEWARAVPNQVAPYREYAALLLESGRIASADSVIAAAARIPGAARTLAAERARVATARGEWDAAARSWRLAVENGPHLVSAASFALGEAGEGSREAIRAALLAPPVSTRARQLLAELELAWGSPTDAWRALSGLFPDSAAGAVWSSFAERAEAAEAWIPAREAWRAAMAVRCDADASLRAANASIRGGDSRTALSVLEDPRCPARGANAQRVGGALRVRALAAAGRATEATNVLAGLTLNDEERRILTRDVAWAWVRSGDIGKAKALMGESLADDTTGVRGWLALYEGDLATARAALRESGTPSTDAVRALAILARTRADRSPALGAAFLALARGDTVTAYTQLESAAHALGDAEPALLGQAAELRGARGDVTGAMLLWQRIVDQWEQSADAPAADLALARALAARGDTVGAKARAEHLILTYPNSALVPQARRVLDALASGV